MDNKKFLEKLNFVPKENSAGVFIKKYPQAGNYAIEVNIEKQRINYGGRIKTGRNTCLIFDESHKENYVTLECANRLLEKGYKPENIYLEKGYPAGRGSTKYLDILVSQNKKLYLMIECKTYGEEFDKELKNLQNTGGQLFAYFQQDTKTALLMLYASDLKDNRIISQVKIIEIEDGFRKAGNVKEAYKLWNGKFYEKGFWENPPYNFERQKFTKNNLRELNDIEGRSLFNKFATILRKHSVSDKPNAFNKIFNLFLAKLYDEQKKPNDELDFHWRDDDNPVDFQVRLFNLHKEGLKAFLEKELAGIYDKDFEGCKSKEELLEKKKNILKINKIYDIKEVFDDDTFEQNHRVLKEVVELLQQYQIRYPRKQRHLSEFFEQLLTTGLKQEAGQYFTPPAITKFIIKSLPLYELLEEKINQPAPSLPATIDYAAGSGHFITEILEEYQDIIEKFDTSDFYPKAQKEVAAWKADPYNWAARYVYGIEKDYRLVKVAKVGCYFYGDGLAQVVLGDGLDSFEKSKSYIGLLRENAKKPQFSVLVSNPPYSVDGVKDDLEYIEAQNEFKLFKNLTDKSSEIEALFVERTAQLLEKNGVAGIVLPSSILSNSGIYTKAREIILQNFDIVAIVQLGGNTFMATNTNTVVLFLRKRDNAEVKRIEEATYNIAENYSTTREDLTINGIEKPVQKYFGYTGETKIDHEKFYYFVLNYHQKTVIVKTGEKEDEKRFLGYNIVKRRGDEGYHSMQNGKTIDECTKLYDDSENEAKANFYINKAFSGEFPKIHESLKNNVFYVDFIDMLTFDREKFDKNISLAVKKKVKIKSKWNLVRLGDYVDINKFNKKQVAANELIKLSEQNTKEVKLLPSSKDYDLWTTEEKAGNNIFEGEVFTLGVARYANSKYYFGKFVSANNNIISLKDTKKEETTLKYIWNVCYNYFQSFYKQTTQYPQFVKEDFSNFKIPLPSLEIQQKIVAEIEILEKKEKESKAEIEKFNINIIEMADNLFFNYELQKLGSVCDTPIYGANESAIDGNPEKDYRYIRITDIKNDGTLNNDWKTAEKIEEKYILKDGDFLFARSGATAGKTFLYKNKYGKALYAGYLIKFPVKQDILNSSYLNFILKSNVYQNWVLSIRRGTAQPNINAQQYSSFEIPLPPLPEQKKIVAEIEKIETQIAEAQKIIDETAILKNEVLKKYGVKGAELATEDTSGG